MAAGLVFRLGGAEGLPAIIKCRLLREYPGEDGHGVVEIIAVERRLSFFELFTQWPRNLVERFFCHDCILQINRAKIHTKY